MRPWIVVRPPVTAVTPVEAAVLIAEALEDKRFAAEAKVATREVNAFALSPDQVFSTAVEADPCFVPSSVIAVWARPKASPARVAPPVSPSSFARSSFMGAMNWLSSPSTLIPAPPC
jgi:hypothetical protein